MISESNVTKILEDEKKRRIIEQYLREKFKGEFDPNWLNNMANYANLAAAIDFFYKLNNENLNIIAIGSGNVDTRESHLEQFKTLEGLLDKLVVLTRDNPPVATAFNEKGAILEGLDLNQRLGTRSLRDLHAQNSNLGIAEKLLNRNLGQTEWLGEVDLERLLIKLGVKDRVHITRLTAEDIGMILHFERVKHGESTVPYTIPLLINRGSTGSLRSQGSHWTYAMVTVNPTTNAITINYQDSMALSGTEQGILTEAINYVDAPYSAFPGAVATVNVASDNLQRDGWSCGYRALKGLLTDPSFPVHGGVDAGVNWITFTGTPTESDELRDVIYQLLLSDLEIDQDYLEEMELDSEMVSSKGSKKYELNDKYTSHYMELLKGGNKTKSVVTTDHFEKEYKVIIDLLSKSIPTTDRKESYERLRKGFQETYENKSLSPDAKLLATFHTFASEYGVIIKSIGGSNSGLGKFIKRFCEEQFGAVLDKEQRYHLKKDGLLMRMLDDRLGVTVKKSEEESLLPPITETGVESTKTSKSTPVVGSTKIVTPTVSPSVDSVRTEGVELGKTFLRSNKELTRVGSMFGEKQFCFARKSSGVEPGFRAIDLDDAFFAELEKILTDENLGAAVLDKQLSGKGSENLIGLRESLKSVSLERKQALFSTFINVHVKGPHRDGVLDDTVKWLCKEVKDGVETNEKLSSWLYKLDYAEGQKDKIKANKEAMREYVGTRLARIFSPDNQNQNLVWVNGSKGLHSMLACGWQNGLHVLKEYLHGGEEPDYNGVLVEDKNALVKRSMRIPGLGKNLIFGIAVGDRDG